LDQTSKLLDFVERYCAAYESLAKVTETKRDDVESILVSAARAVREDLTAERAALPEFEKGMASTRSLPRQSGIDWRASTVAPENVP
jgi:hypothetical protein